MAGKMHNRQFCLGAAAPPPCAAYSIRMLGGRQLFVPLLLLSQEWIGVAEDSAADIEPSLAFLALWVSTEKAPKFEEKTAAALLRILREAVLLQTMSRRCCLR